MSMVQRAQKEGDQRMKGPNLAVLVKWANGTPFEEGLRKVNDANKVFASNKRLDMALQSDEWKQISGALWCWSGTMTAYTTQDQKLGKQIEYTDPETGYRWVFKNRKYRWDETNVILVAEHPNYTLEVDGKNRVIHVPEDKLEIVREFPISNGWYLANSPHGLPMNIPHSFGKSTDLRHLVRIDKRVGPVARGYTDIIYKGKILIDLSIKPSEIRGVVVEAAP